MNVPLTTRLAMLMLIAIILQEASSVHVAKVFSEQAENVKKASVRTMGSY